VAPLLQAGFPIDTVVPLNKNMDAYQDVVGLTGGKHFRWEVWVEPEAAADSRASPLAPGARWRAWPAASAVGASVRRH